MGERYTVRRIEDAKDNWWDVLEDGEAIALTSEEHARAIAAAMNARPSDEVTGPSTAQMTKGGDVSVDRFTVANPAPAGLDVERLARAIHAGDCIPNGLGMHAADNPEDYCRMIAPAVASAYARLERKG